MHKHVGCSGFYYPEWKDIFYPEKLAKSKWLEYYSEHFDTLEVNSSFYRFPKLSLFNSWYNRTPDHFKFSVKVPQNITHFKKFIGTVELLKEFYDLSLNGLQEKLGCILFQLPPSYSYSEERLNLLLSSVDPAFRNIIEFRHVTWWEESIYSQLADANITFCSISHPKLPDAMIFNTPLFYLRMHGVPALYSSEYDTEKLKSIANQIRENKPEEVFAYFNNTMNVKAIANAEYLRSAIS